MAAVDVIQKNAEVALLSNMVMVPSAYLNQIERRARHSFLQSSPRKMSPNTGSTGELMATPLAIKK